MSNKDVVDCAWQVIHDNKNSSDVHKTCGECVELILKTSASRRTLDNITVVFLAFSEYLAGHSKNENIANVPMNSNNSNYIEKEAKKSRNGEMRESYSSQHAQLNKFNKQSLINPLNTALGSSLSEKKIKSKAKIFQRVKYSTQSEFSSNPYDDAKTSLSKERQLNSDLHNNLSLHKNMITKNSETTLSKVSEKFSDSKRRGSHQLHNNTQTFSSGKQRTQQTEEEKEKSKKEIEINKSKEEKGIREHSHSVNTPNLSHSKKDYKKMNSSSNTWANKSRYPNLSTLKKQYSESNTDSTTVSQTSHSQEEEEAQAKLKERLLNEGNTRKAQIKEIIKMKERVDLGKAVCKKQSLNTVSSCSENGLPPLDMSIPHTHSHMGHGNRPHPPPYPLTNKSSHADNTGQKNFTPQQLRTMNHHQSHPNLKFYSPASPHTHTQTQTQIQTQTQTQTHTHAYVHAHAQNQVQPKSLYSPSNSNTALLSTKSLHSAQSFFPGLHNYPSNYNTHNQSSNQSSNLRGGSAIPAFQNYKPKTSNFTNNKDI